MQLELTKDRLTLLLCALAMNSVLWLGCSTMSKQATGSAKMAQNSAPASSNAAEPSAPSRDESFLSETISRDALPENAGAESERSAEPSMLSIAANDPFGLIPGGWPGEVPVHPEGRVFDGGKNPSGELYLKVLARSDKVTSSGVLNFYTGILSGWESVRVEEEPDKNPKNGGNSKTPVFSISAERSGSSLKITVGPSPDKIYLEVSNKDYWKREMGAHPLLIVLIYSTVR